MKIKKDDWLYVLPHDVCEIRDIILKGKFYYEAIMQVKPEEIRKWHLETTQKNGVHPRGKLIYAALERDEIGNKLLLFPSPAQDYEMDLTVMKVAVL